MKKMMHNKAKYFPDNPEKRASHIQ